MFLGRSAERDYNDSVFCEDLLSFNPGEIFEQDFPSSLFGWSQQVEKSASIGAEGLVSM